MPSDILKILTEACTRARNDVYPLLGKDEAYESCGVGAGGDISRKIDIVAEKAVIDTLKRHNLKCIVLAEEAGKVDLGGGKPDGFVVVDAVDGTTNALRGIPFCCCALAFADANRLSSVRYGAVIDLFTGDVYSASKGEGAFLNGSKISAKPRGDGAAYYVVGMNVSGVQPDKVHALLPIMKKSNHIRHLGANALELCIFARGLMDVFIDMRGKIRITDMAAAYLIAKEAGGMIVGEDGRELDSDIDTDARLSFIAASSRKILEDVAKDAGVALKI